VGKGLRGASLLIIIARGQISFSSRVKSCTAGKSGDELSDKMLITLAGSKCKWDEVISYELLDPPSFLPMLF